MNKNKPTQEDRVVAWVGGILGLLVVFLSSWAGLALLLGHASAVQAVGLALLIVLAGLVFDAARQANR